jgi:hypothetical protein
MIRKGIRPTNKPTINEIMNEEIEPEPQLDPPRHINNREHYVGVTTIACPRYPVIMGPLLTN